MADDLKLLLACVFSFLAGIGIGYIILILLGLV